MDKGLVSIDVKASVGKSYSYGVFTFELYNFFTSYFVKGRDSRVSLEWGISLFGVELYTLRTVITYLGHQ